MARRFPTPRDDSDRRVIDDVRRHGCHIIHVGGDDQGPGWSFSIGLFHSVEQPELMVFGLPWATTEAIINGLCARMNAGQRFEHGGFDSDVLEDHRVAFLSIPRDKYSAYLGYAMWFYEGDKFPILQMVWPDSRGRFPWHVDCALDNSIQPVLGSHQG